VAELRLLLSWRRLRGRGGTAEAVATFALFAFAIPSALLFAGLLGAASMRAARVGGGLRLDAPVTALFFGVWQAWTALALAMPERDALDLRRFLAYPVRPARLYLLGMASGLVGDPFAAFWLVLMGGAYAGAAVGRFGPWLVPLGAVLLAFAAATVALVSLLQEVFSRLARQRYFREVTILVGVAGWALLALGARQSASELLRTLKAIQWVLFPPALAAAAGRALYAGRVLEAMPWLAALATATLACGWLAYRLALGTARGGGDEGRLSSAPAGVRVPRLMPERLGALFEKEWRYLARHPVARVQLLVAPALAAIVGFKVLPLVPEEAGEVVRALPLFGLAAYVHLALQVFWLNAFGWDRGGARALFLAPLAPRAVLAAKNGAVAVLSALFFVAAGAAFVGAAGWPPAWALVGAVTLHLGMAPFLHGAGNLVSILNPRAAPYALQRGGSLPALSSLGGMAIVSGTTGLFALPVLLALRLDSPWTLVAGWLALAAMGWAGWAWSLPRAGRLLVRRRESLLAEICGEAQ
jgi:ABC-2 type transport system permease protein